MVSGKRAAAASILLRAGTGVPLLLSASWPRLPTVSAVDFPPIPAGSARIWFYRVYDPTESKGPPYIYMNGVIVGISDQGYAFYRDCSGRPLHVPVESYGRDLFQFRNVALVPPASKHMQRFCLLGAGWNRAELQSRYVLVLTIPPLLHRRKTSHYPFLAIAEPSRDVAIQSNGEVTAN